MRKLIGMGLVAALATGLGGQASAQALFDGCPSDQILERFAEFGRTGKMPPDLGGWLNNPEAQYVEPWSPFDNVDYVGICWVSAWLVHTEEGTVLIDALYGPFTQTLVDNIAKTGTDLADIKYVLMTHGHFDHVGGAATLKPLLPNATFVMTQGGWDEAVAASEESQGGPRAWDMIEPEMVVADGDRISLGDNTFTVLETPGHTWGTASYVYDVRDEGETYRAITIGGLGLNAIEGPPQVEAFIESLDRMRALTEAGDMGIDVHLTTHGFSNNLDEDRQALADRVDGQPNVMVDPEGLLAQIETLRAGAEDRLASEEAK
ncbi:metallo-beta-lactamase class B [Poseidonocella pacifica]|uniref:Metallo-beta-lactamase class B n=1 Tax=Poseidonocella pacifica TaxID=871651 RepID=A0A1I0UXR3_9RHOB|nr:MBL fold metallo-hydrolase [Poseidonocella pacifica]SFA68831.1 metallo-beta-lactamase class B [Poseidonocella pacifica]